MVHLGSSRSWPYFEARDLGRLDSGAKVTPRRASSPAGPPSHTCFATWRSDGGHTIEDRAAVTPTVLRSVYDHLAGTAWCWRDTAGWGGRARTHDPRTIGRFHYVRARRVGVRWGRRMAPPTSPIQAAPTPVSPRPRPSNGPGLRRGGAGGGRGRPPPTPPTQAPPPRAPPRPPPPTAPGPAGSRRGPAARPPASREQPRRPGPRRRPGVCSPRRRGGC